MSTQTIMVIGAGQMGSGIAQAVAQAGFQVILNDIKRELVEKGVAGIRRNLSRDVGKGRKTQEEMDFVMEAIIENMEIKLGLFRKLYEVCPNHTILASNTSSLSITEIAATTKRPENVIGMHFMNPVLVMNLIEVIRGLATSDETYHIVEDLSKKIGKVPVEVNDFPGFVSNRILLPMINEAIYCVYEGVATPQTVDKVMKLGMNHPMGPLALADFIGLDTCLYILEVLHEGFGDSKYRPCPLLQKYVKAGWLGKKSGRGFYVYE